MIYFEAIIQLFSLIWSFYFRYTWEILVGGGDSILVELQALPFWWKWGLSWVSQVFFLFYLLCERPVWENCL